VRAPAGLRDGQAPVTFGPVIAAAAREPREAPMMLVAATIRGDRPT
jgi:hypothetical protein